MTNSKKLSTVELEAWEPFMRMQEMLRSRLEQNLMSRSNLSSADYTVLAVLTQKRDEPLRPADLGKLIGWEKSRLHHQLTRMAKRNLVERRPAPELGTRAVEIVCTQEGREALIAAAPEHTEDVRRWVIGVLTSEQLEQVGQISRAILVKLEE